MTRRNKIAAVMYNMTHEFLLFNRIIQKCSRKKLLINGKATRK